MEKEQARLMKGTRKAHKKAFTNEKMYMCFSLKGKISLLMKMTKVNK